MSSHFIRSSSLARALTRLLLSALVVVCAAGDARPQEEFEEDADPVKIFNRGQAAHQKGVASRSREDLEAAVELYDEAIRLRPEFPEAELQRAFAFVALERAADAERGFRRALELRPDSPQAVSALGLLLARDPARASEAEKFLRRAVELNSEDAQAAAALAALRARAGDSSGVLAHLRRVTDAGGDAAGVEAWVARGEAEKTAGEREAALKSFTRALGLDAGNKLARFRRAEIYFEGKDFESASKDLAHLDAAVKTDTRLALAVASLYSRMERKQEARRVLESLPEAERLTTDVRNLLASLTSVDCDPRPESRAALERLLEAEPKNAPLLACLGELNRTTDPARALEYFRRANEADPRSAKYAVGYAAALVQLRKFPEAASLLKRVLELAPDDYAARANFATALYEMGLYKEAIAEYNWMARARPDLAVLHFFIGTAHDKLGEFTDALAAYETFLARADQSANSLEIGKVNLRLPSLRNQIKRGEGVKKKDASKKKKS
ncbi:MAG TPA: tetratricopeptide repeat protein [Pyrinomonadaceae bacterium]|nr:tetratricopeptide repeat protein [Pyrinomonadaceae bacterium]